MAIVAEPTTPEERTEHPYVIRMPGVAGGRPVVRNSRTAVWHIARLFRAGYTASEIAQEFEHLSLAAIYDAISYYLDHRSEVDGDIAANTVEAALREARAARDAQGRVRFSD
ncbi:MAG: DUF433 domain-containing protein [Anaerolineales bacterium]|nr:DUF433 domain-containing protein [Anaerolineales bacterium]